MECRQSGVLLGVDTDMGIPSLPPIPVSHCTVFICVASTQNAVNNAKWLPVLAVGNVCCGLIVYMAPGNVQLQPWI